MIQLAATLHRGAAARARRFRQALRGNAADRDARVALSAGAGLRLGRAEGRRRARRHRPEIQPAGGPRAAARLRPGAAVHPDHAAARRARRRGEDVQVARQLRRHRRAAAGDVRQADVDLRRADVALLRAAVLRVARDDRSAGSDEVAKGAIRATSRCASPRRSSRASMRARRPSRARPISTRASATARCPRTCPRSTLAARRRAACRSRSSLKQAGLRRARPRRCA